jgi:hypothetical protein
MSNSKNRVPLVVDRSYQSLETVNSDAGFPDSAVKVGVRERKAGIAHDIRAESHPNYACVILGRKQQESLWDHLFNSRIELMRLMDTISWRIRTSGMRVLQRKWPTESISSVG